MRTCNHRQFCNLKSFSNSDVLDKLLSLDVVHAMDTGNTITTPSSVPIPFFIDFVEIVPDGKNTTSLSETCLFLDTCAIISFVVSLDPAFVAYLGCAVREWRRPQ